MPIRGVRRGKTLHGFANPDLAPLYVDSDDDILKMIPAGGGTTEVELVDSTHTQTISGDKTFTGTVVISGIATVTEFADGSVTAPSITFNSDTDSGIYRIGDNNIGIALAGAIEWNLTTTAFSPGASGGSALGTTSLMWNGLCLADATAINWSNSNVTLTHSTGNLALAGGNLTISDDLLLGIGTGNTARFSYDTTDANANCMLLQLPAGGSVDVPVLIIGQGVESKDFGLYNAVVDPRIAIFSTGAVTTGSVVEFRKSRGSVASPTVVTSGDDLGTINFYGAVAAGEYVLGASIRADMVGTIATTRGPSTLTFLTATDAAPSVLTTALTLNAAQQVLVADGAAAAPPLAFVSEPTMGLLRAGAGEARWAQGGFERYAITATSINNFSDTGTFKIGSSLDLILGRESAAVLQLGLDAAGITNQMIKGPDRITSDGVGGNLTLAGGRNRGASVGGSLIFQTSPATTATTDGVLATALTIDSTGTSTFPGATPIVFTGSVTKGLNFNGVTPVYTSQENAYLSVGTYTVPVTVASTNATFIPIQVNLSSTGNMASAGNQVAAARLRVDSDTNAQGNTAIHCLQLRSDIGTDVYAAALISASLNVSAATSIPTATMQGIYVAITGASAITCPNNVNVLEAVYKQTTGGAGVDNVAELACNASGCSLTNILDIHHYAGTLTNGINISGTMTTGITSNITGPTVGTGGTATVYGARLLNTAAFGGTPQAGTLMGLSVETTGTGTFGMDARALNASYTTVGKVMTGFFSAGSFEIFSTNTTDQCDSAVIDLRDHDDGTAGHPASSYIRLRVKGSQASDTGRRNFVNFYDEDEASAHDSGRMLTETSNTSASSIKATHLIRCFINDAVIYLMATTTAPLA